ncbi:MAG TPA: CoA-binding protein [Deltaproteobacteria bacterium]|nr:CoA-binding protein [Deltaproteobacteria bacterium]
MKDHDQAVKELLNTSHVIAIVGLSGDESKDSNKVGRFLQSKGYRIIPVNPGTQEILGEKSYRSLSEITEKVDVVDIFMRSEKVVPVVEEAIKLHPKAIWLQIGIVNHEAKGLVERADIEFFSDICVKREHERLFPKGD